MMLESLPKPHTMPSLKCLREFLSTDKQPYNLLWKPMGLAFIWFEGHIECKGFLLY